MLLPAPPLYPRKRKPKAKAPLRVPVIGPVLASATYEQGSAVDLTFDRAIDIAGLDPATLSLWDGEVGFQYVGTADVTQPTDASVRIAIDGVEEWIGAGVRMTVTSANGIVAADGGASWAGVTDVELPFP